MFAGSFSAVWTEGRSLAVQRCGLERCTLIEYVCTRDEYGCLAGHEDVAVIKERTPQPGHAMNLRAARSQGNIAPSQRTPAGVKSADLTRQRCALLAGISLDIVVA
jgi:hypothetical protein